MPKGSKSSIMLLIERFLQRLIVAHPTFFLRTLIEASKGTGSEPLNVSISDAVIEIFSNRENSHSDLMKLGQSVGGQIVFGQEGEDIFLTRVFGNKANGFFVDVGAHHPTRFSNT